MEMHRWGQRYKTICQTLSFPRSTAASIIRKQKQSWLFCQAFCFSTVTGQEEPRSQSGSRNTSHTNRVSLQEGRPSQQHSVSQSFIVEWLDRRLELKASDSWLILCSDNSIWADVQVLCLVNNRSRIITWQIQSLQWGFSDQRTLLIP